MTDYEINVLKKTQQILSSFEDEFAKIQFEELVYIPEAAFEVDTVTIARDMLKIVSENLLEIITQQEVEQALINNNTNLEI